VRRQREAAREKITAEGLQMRATQKSPRQKCGFPGLSRTGLRRLSLRSLHD
jgi:hypothetical protein